MESLLTAQQVADLVHCCRRHVLRSRQRGLLAGSRLGQAWVFSEAAVQAWVDANTTAATAPIAVTFATRSRATK